MAQKANTSFRWNAGGMGTFVARVKGRTGADITIASLASITRLITRRVSGQPDVEQTDALVVASVVFDTLQTNTNIWDQQYNFLDEVPPTKISERVRYTLQYTFVPTAGAAYTFKTEEVDIEGD